MLHRHLVVLNAAGTLLTVLFASNFAEVYRSCCLLQSRVYIHGYTICNRFSAALKHSWDLNTARPMWQMLRYKKGQAAFKKTEKDWSHLSPSHST